MKADQTPITLEAMQQMFSESEERLEKKLTQRITEKIEEKFEPEFLNIYRKISSLDGVFRLLQQSIMNIRGDVEILKREAIQTNQQLNTLEEKSEQRFSDLNVCINDLEQSMNKQFKILADETINYTDGATKHYSLKLDNHEERIITLEEKRPMVS